MKHSNSTIQHLDGTVNSSEVSSHYRRNTSLSTINIHTLSLQKENLENNGKENGTDSHWVAAEPPSDGLRWATWSTEIRSASTFFKATRKWFNQTIPEHLGEMIKERNNANLNRIAWADKNKLWNPIYDMQLYSCIDYSPTRTECVSTSIKAANEKNMKIWCWGK